MGFVYRSRSRYDLLPYAAVKQLEGKYLVQNRVTGEIYARAVPLTFW